MESIGDRIKHVRKCSCLTLEKFGAKIGIGKSALSQFEGGKARPSERTLLAICKEFNVNGEWLRTGEGEMFLPRSRDDEIEAFVTELLKSGPESFRRRFVSALAKLDENDWETFERFAANLAETIPAEDTPSPEQEIEAKVEAYRQQLLAEKKGSFSAFPAAENYPEELPDILA